MLSTHLFYSTCFSKLRNEFESLKVMSNDQSRVIDLGEDFDTETEQTILNLSNMLCEVFNDEFNIEFDSSDDVIFNYLRDMTTYQDQDFEKFWSSVQGFYEDEISGFKSRSNLSVVEHKMFRMNLGKQITFVTGLGDVATGFIKGANKIMYGQFAYEVSKSKNPRSEFKIGSGTWYLVDPSRIIY